MRHLSPLNALHSGVLAALAFTCGIPAAWAQSPSAETPTKEQSAPANELLPPKLLNNIQPEYPVAAQEQGVAASVLLEIDVGVDGKVGNASIAEGAAALGYGFDEAALAAAKLLQFEPASEKGKAVAVRINFRFRFVPNVKQQDVAPVPGDASSAPSSDAAPRAEARGSKQAGPTAQLSGTLVERGTRLPLSGVKITVFRGEGDSAEGFETETDAEGKFRLEGLGIGTWRLLADPKGYYPLRTIEELRKGSRTDVKYAIERGAYNPYDVQVDTKRIEREVNHIAIDARQAERIPGTFGDVLAVIKNFPGVARTGGGGPFSSGLVIRGSAPSDSNILVNGVTVPLLYHFGDVRSVLPAGMIEKVNFYPGNFSVQYGRANGGIVDVELRDLKRKNLGGYLDLNVFDASLYLEAPLTDKLSIAIAGRRSYIDTVLNAALSGNGNSVVAPRYYDAQALVSYRPTPAHQIKGFFFLSDDKFKILFENPVAANAKTLITDVGLMTNFYRGMLEYKFVPNAKFENDLKLSYGRDLNAFNVGQALGIDAVLQQGQVRDQARIELMDSLTLRAGVDYLFQRRRFDATLPQLPQEGQGNADFDLSNTTTTSSTRVYHSPAGFAELELKPLPGMLAIPGVRADYFSRTNRVAVSPRFTIRQKITPEWLLKGGVGLFQQEPTFEQTDKNLGNPNLRLEKALHYSAGFEYTPLPFLSLNVTGFYKTLFDMAGSTDQVTTVEGKTVPLNYNNDGKGRVVGLEVLAKHELHNNLFAWVAYTLSKSERRDPGSNSYRLFDYDQTHIVTVLGSYRLPHNWEIGARFRYVTGNLYTPVTGAVYDADRDEYRAASGRTNSARVNAFHQLDVRIDKRWVFQNWMLNAYLDIQNVYNQGNIDNPQYNYDYSKILPQQSLPIIPILGLKGEF